MDDQLYIYFRQIKMNKITNKRSYEDNDIEQRERQFDFIYSDNEDENLSGLFEKLIPIKQQLNDVKALLSDKDIADWNRLEDVDKKEYLIVLSLRHTAYMNTASTIVPYLREKLNIEIGTQAWAKMFEILSNFDLINYQTDQKWISLHLCEAPGAFISALNHFLVTRSELFIYLILILFIEYQKKPKTSIGNGLLKLSILIMNTIHRLQRC
jgi:hypothetical protein